LLTGESACVLETLIFHLLLHFGRIIFRGVLKTPVVSVHNGSETEPPVFEALGDAVFENGLTVIRGDAIVVGIKRFDKVVVEFLVEEFSVLAICCKTCLESNYVFAKVFVDETGGREFRVVGGIKRLLETTLVMVVSSI
jgi:hypothetical protein